MIDYYFISEYMTANCPLYHRYNGAGKCDAPHTVQDKHYRTLTEARAQAIKICTINLDRDQYIYSSRDGGKIYIEGSVGLVRDGSDPRRPYKECMSWFIGHKNGWHLNKDGTLGRKIKF